MKKFSENNIEEKPCVCCWMIDIENRKCGRETILASWSLPNYFNYKVYGILERFYIRFLLITAKDKIFTFYNSKSGENWSPRYQNIMKDI